MWPAAALDRAPDQDDCKVMRPFGKGNYSLFRAQRQLQRKLLGMTVSGKVGQCKCRCDAAQIELASRDSFGQDLRTRLSTQGDDTMDSGILLPLLQAWLMVNVLFVTLRVCVIKTATT